jgi:hypothetical protein
MSWDDIIRRVLPPINGVQPHITGPAGRFGAGEAEGRQDPSSILHGGVDFNYIGGQTSRLNRSNPVLRSPVDGIVVNAGQGTVGRIAIRDKNGFIHEILHTSAQHVTNGDPVVAGQIIGAPAPQVAPNPDKRSEADDGAQVRVLSRVNLSPASGDGPTLAPASAPPLLGVFSGQPMRDHPVWPSIFATDDRSSPDDDELYRRWRQWLDA